MDEKKMSLEEEIRNCQQFLARTDYQCLKHSDGALSDEEYEETKAKRQEWRDTINQDQAELEKLDAEDEEQV